MYEQDPSIQEGRLALGSPDTDEVEANGITLTGDGPLRELRAACKSFGFSQSGSKLTHFERIMNASYIEQSRIDIFELDQPECQVSWSSVLVFASPKQALQIEQIQGKLVEEDEKEEVEERGELGGER